MWWVNVDRVKMRVYVPRAERHAWQSRLMAVAKYRRTKSKTGTMSRYQHAFQFADGSMYVAWPPAYSIGRGGEETPYAIMTIHAAYLHTRDGRDQLLATVKKLFPNMIPPRIRGVAEYEAAMDIARSPLNILVVPERPRTETLHRPQTRCLGSYALNQYHGTKRSGVQLKSYDPIVCRAEGFARALGHRCSSTSSNCGSRVVQQARSDSQYPWRGHEHLRAVASATRNEAVVRPRKSTQHQI